MRQIISLLKPATLRKPSNMFYFLSSEISVWHAIYLLLEQQAKLCACGRIIVSLMTSNLPFFLLDPHRRLLIQDHRITPIGGDLGRSLCPPFCTDRISYGTNKVTQGFIQLGVENLHSWRWLNLFGQYIPLLDCSHDVSLYSAWTYSSFTSMSMRLFPTLWNTE